MGSHMNRIVGLNDRAEKLMAGEEVLLYTEQVNRIYPDGRKEALPPQEVRGSPTVSVPSGETFDGMFGERFPLHRFTLADGRVFFERLQVDFYSAGLVAFFALQSADDSWVAESLWTKEEIYSSMGWGNEEDWLPTEEVSPGVYVILGPEGKPYDFFAESPLVKTMQRQPRTRSAGSHPINACPRVLPLAGIRA